MAALSPATDFVPSQVVLRPSGIEAKDHWIIFTALEEAVLPPLPPGLRSLSIHDCAHVEEFSLENTPDLEFLRVLNAPALKRLPPLPPTLKWICIGNCPLLESLPSLPPSLESLVCSQCPKIDVLPPLPAALRALVCPGCPLAIPMTPNPLGKMVSLHADPSWIVYTGDDLRDYAAKWEAWRHGQCA
jgi:hypothetical protein